MTADEFDTLLYERLGLRREHLVAALKMLPPDQPRSAQLTASEVRFLDESGFTEDRLAYTENAAAAVTQAAMLISTAYSTSEVASALKAEEDQVHELRISRALWAVPSNGAWLFPALQFHRDPVTGDPRGQINGLDRVFRALPADLHPLAIQRFLRTENTDLHCQTPLGWLGAGNDVGPVLGLVDVVDWAGS